MMGVVANVRQGRGGRVVFAATASALALVIGGVSMPQAAAAQTAQGQIDVDIPAQDLNSALLQLTQRAGLQIVYDADKVVGRRSSAVRGSFTPTEALSQMLVGTGLTFRVNSGNRVTLDIAPQAADGAIQLGPVSVEGEGGSGTGYPIPPTSTLSLPPEYVGGQVARGGRVGMLGNKDVMDTPFSTTSYTNQTIENQQAQTVQEILANDPSVISQTRGNNDNDIDMIRGFVGNGPSGIRSLNGLAGMAPLDSPTVDMIERVEVLRGPGALLNGSNTGAFGSVGGSVNLITKRAGDDPLTQLTMRYISRTQLGAHADVGRRFGTNNQFGIRFNGAFLKGDTPVNSQDMTLGSASLNMDYRGERVRVSVDLAHQSRQMHPERAYITLGTLSVIPRPPRSNINQLPSWGETRTKSTLAMARVEVDITDNVTAYAAIGAQRWSIYKNGVLTGAALTNATGRYQLAPNRSLNEYDTLSMQGGLRATFVTGPIDHALSFNVSQSNREIRGATVRSTPVTVDNIYNPVFPAIPTMAGLPSLAVQAKNSLTSVGIADTMSVLDGRIQLITGIRYQRVAATNFNVATGLVSSDYASSAWTPAIAIVVKPRDNISLYANYIEDLQGGTTVPSAFANAGEVFPPYRSKQYEAGVKIDWGRVTTTFAAFQITQPNLIATLNPGGLPTLSLSGEQRNRGVELNAYGEIADGIRLLAGVTFLDARLMRTANGTYDGNRASGAAVRAVVGGEWDLPFVSGLTLNGRVTYTGDQVVSNTNERLRIPSWAQLDLGARYRFASAWTAQPITLRFNVDNVLNKSNWAVGYSGSLIVNEPRTYRFSASFNF
jgi:iron complex outermembrane receptor protein